MAQLTTNRAHAFGAGSPLWIIPSPTAETPLLRRIDWYLNFQLSRARAHQTRTLAAPLKDILTENQMEPLMPPSEAPHTNSPLAVIAGDRLPTDVVVELPSLSPQKWVHLALSVWTDFGKPNVRVFLPEKVDADYFYKFWPSASSDQVSIVAL